MTAIVEGVVTLEDDCLLLDGSPVIWPEGTQWDAQAQTVRLPNGEMAAMGDRVSGGGGYYTNGNSVSRVYGSGVGSAAAACGRGEVAVFNPGSDVSLVP